MSFARRAAPLAVVLGALACGSTVTFPDGDGGGDIAIPTSSSGTAAGGSGAGGSSSGTGASGAGGSSSSSSGTGASGAGGSSSSSSGTGASGAGGSSSSSSGTGASGAGGSSSSSSSGGGGPPVCPPLYGECSQCASANCPEIWCGCVENPECLDLFQCTGNCNDDPACEQQCLSAHQDGISAALLVSGCAGTTCSGFCEWGDDAFTPCEQCIYEDCSSEMNACLAVVACTALWSCLDGCAPYDLSCQQQCYLDHPAGVGPLEVALQCIVDLCEQPCN